MAVNGWILDKSAAARAGDARVASQLAELAGSLFVCEVGELEQIYSARSASDYDALKADLRASFRRRPHHPTCWRGLYVCSRTLRTITACGTERRFPTS